MEPQPRHRPYNVLFVIAVCVALGYLCYRVLLPFLGAIAWATILAVAFHAPWERLRVRLPKRINLAAGLMTLSIALIAVLPATLFLASIASQVADLAGRVSEHLETLHVNSVNDVIALPDVAAAIETIQTRAGISQEDFQKLAAGFATKASAYVGKISKQLALGAFDAILTFFATIFVLFFFFRDGQSMSAALIDLIPTDAANRAELGQSLRRMIQAIFRGSLLCSLVQGFTGGVGWAIAGLPSPALAGAAMAATSLIPLGGTSLIWIPGVLWAWFSGNHGSAIFLAIWGMAVTSFLADNVLRPILIGKNQDFSMLVVFLGVFGGLMAFGLLGIFIGPLTLALATTVIGVLRLEAHPPAGPSAGPSLSPPA